MIDSLQISAEGMNSRIFQQEVIANNLANLSTVGFKRDKVFQDVLTEATVHADPKIKEVTIFEQGALRETKNALDFALVGDGFFSVQMPEGIRYTRNGNFKLDSSGQIVLEEGSVVMGENGPIEVKGEITVNEEGQVFINDVLVDKLRIVTFDKPYPLKKIGNSLFILADENFSEIETIDIQIKQGFLEESNVNPIEEMVNMLTVYRYFEADQKALRAYDEILNKAVNDIGKL